MGEVSSQLLPLSSQQLPAAVWNLWPLAQSPSPVVLSCVHTFQLNHIHPGRLSTGLRPPPPHTLSWTDSFLSAGGSSHCTLPWSCLLRTSTPALGSRTTWAGGWGQGRGSWGKTEREWDCMLFLPTWMRVVASRKQTAPHGPPGPLPHTPGHLLGGSCGDTGDRKKTLLRDGRTLPLPVPHPHKN